MRRLLNVVNLTTPAGLALARAGRCRICRGPDGLVLAEGWSWTLPKAAAFTVGNVVLYRSRAAPLFRPGTGGPGSSPLLRHEARHSSQYAGLGLAFLPLYFLAAGVSKLRHGDPASGNIFERLAGLDDGGYRRTVSPAPSRAPSPLRHPRPRRNGRKWRF
ncbi:hypothetical protein QNO00_09010 [Arthrobacter sp. zg-Y1219]|uniref:hypothetical protein n=1 Tax=Arthrobacter sp. zg-Y1219 TaxID=3049067 RepID=UPI0024C35030|nr:hypothetical protein [Arthrobacter sp. zg-Y1219]MDK1360406.1 hypothetical protein [Arthrobacter sp. zg-Y1219]